MKAAPFKCTGCSKFSTTSENYSLLCLDLQSGLRNRRFNIANPYSWQVLYITEDSASHTNITYSITIGRSPE